LVENLLLEAMHEILESDELDKALTDCEQKPATLFSTTINNQQPPNFDTLLPAGAASELQEMEFRNQNT
jgi:hypothetical protein